jgi:hypothetical protein
MSEQLPLPFDAVDALRCAMRRAPAGATFRDHPADVADRWHDLMTEIYAAAARACR